MRRLSLALVLLPTLVAAQPHPSLKSGPMVAYAEMTEVAVWVQTSKPAEVKIRYGMEGGFPTVTDAYRTTADGDFIANIKLKGLPFGKKFGYGLIIDGQEVKRDYPLEFETQPHWRFTTGQNTPEFTFAFGSCSYFNDAPFDRPGTPYGGPTAIFHKINELKPNFMMWLGDNDYYREPDWLTEAAMRNRMAHGRAYADLQPLLGRTPNYAIWDDHDFGPNDSDRSYRLKAESLRIFGDYWPSVQRGTPDTPGVFNRFEWVDCEFFMLDDRYHRSPNSAKEDADKTMFGKAQVQWLKDSLLNSRAAFKFIVNGNQMINKNAFECFSQFPVERDDLFKFVADNKVDGVLFLSGDRHTSELLKSQSWGMSYPFYEFTSSPLTSGVPSQATPDPLGVPGTFIKDRSFGLVKISGKRGARVATLMGYDKDGKKLWEQNISQADLKAK